MREYKVYTTTTTKRTEMKVYVLLYEHALHLTKCVKQRKRVFAARQAHQNTITVAYAVEITYCLHISAEKLAKQRSAKSTNRLNE